MNSTILFALAEDLSRSNGVLCLGTRPELEVIGAVWIAPVALSREIPIEVRGECLKYVIGRLTACWPDWELWLVVGSAGFRPDNRITRYYRAWPLLKELGVPRTDILESVQESSEGLRYFGAARFDHTHIDSVHDIMKRRYAAIIFMDRTQAKETVEEVLQRKWLHPPTSPPEEVLEIASPRGGLVVAGYGAFDDPEVAVAAIGKKELLQPLIDKEMNH